MATIKFDRPEVVTGQKIAITVIGATRDSSDDITVKIYDNDSVFYDDRQRQDQRQHFTIKEVRLKKEGDIYVNHDIDTSDLSPGNHTAVFEEGNNKYSDRIRIISPQSLFTIFFKQYMLQ